MSTETLSLTNENVEKVLDELRPFLISDGGNVEIAEIDGPIVKVRLQGACGSCPSFINYLENIFITYYLTPSIMRI